MQVSDLLTLLITLIYNHIQFHLFKNFQKNICFSNVTGSTHLCYRSDFCVKWTLLSCPPYTGIHKLISVSCINSLKYFTQLSFPANWTMFISCGVCACTGNHTSTHHSREQRKEDSVSTIHHHLLFKVWHPVASNITFKAVF